MQAWTNKHHLKYAETSPLTENNTLTWADPLLQHGPRWEHIWPADSPGLDARWPTNMMLEGEKEHHSKKLNEGLGNFTPFTSSLYTSPTPFPYSHFANPKYCFTAQICLPPSSNQFQSYRGHSIPSISSEHELHMDSNVSSMGGLIQPLKATPQDINIYLTLSQSLFLLQWNTNKSISSVTEMKWATWYHLPRIEYRMNKRVRSTVYLWYTNDRTIQMCALITISFFICSHYIGSIISC